MRSAPRSDAELRRFVSSHFTLAADAGSSTAIQHSTLVVPIGEHIDALWSELQRDTPTVPQYSSALPLPRPYVVPGGRFRELYYWDSYFTMLGLAQSGRDDLVRDMVDDFAWLIDRYGHVPNGTRSYYLSRSQPPFFFEMVALTQPQDPAAAWTRYLPQLRREYGYWMSGRGTLRGVGARRRAVRMPDGSVLNRYWDDLDVPRDESWREDRTLARGSGRDPKGLYRDIRAAAESGWDFSSRWLRDPAQLRSIQTTQIVPVDLNSLLFGLEQAIRAGCERAGDHVCAQLFAQRAKARHRAIDRYLWNPQRHSYGDYRWTDGQPTGVLSAATLYPLFESVASADQAEQVATVVRRALLAGGGLATTQTMTGQQWDAPNGWAPLQWIAIRALRDNDATTLAATIACRWIVTVLADYEHGGRLVEKIQFAINWGRRWRRIPAAGWLWVDQWRDARAVRPVSGVRLVFVARAVPEPYG